MRDRPTVHHRAACPPVLRVDLDLVVALVGHSMLVPGRGNMQQRLVVRATRPHVLKEHIPIKKNRVFSLALG